MKRFFAVILSTLILLTVFAACSDSGSSTKDTTAQNSGSSDTPKVDLSGVCGTSAKYTIEKAMVAYYAYDDLNYYSSMYGGQLDFSTYLPLFIQGAQESINRYVILASKAAELGYTISDDENKKLEESISQITAVAESNGEAVNDYLAEIYTDGVTIDVIRKCLQLEQIAYKYYDDIEKESNFTDAELEKFRDEHPEMFYKTEFLYVSFDAGISDSTPENEKNEKLEAAHKNALEFAEAAKDPEAFKAELIKRAVEQAKAAVEAEGKEFVRDTDEAYISSATITDYIYQEENTICEWAFADDRKVGDIGIVNMGSGYYVCLMQRTCYYDDYKLANVRQIIFASVNHENSDEKTKELAEKSLKEYLDGEHTEEAFAELAKLNSDDTGSVNTGGLCSMVSKGTLGVPDVENWCIDSGRKAGDTEIIKVDYGYHVMYFISHGEVKWKDDARIELLSEKLDKVIEELSDMYEVTYDKDAVDSIISK